MPDDVEGEDEKGHNKTWHQSLSFFHSKLEFFRPGPDRRSNTAVGRDKSGHYKQAGNSHDL